MIYHHLAPCDLGQIAASGQCFRMEARAEGWWRICAGARCVRVRQEGERLAFDTSEEEYQAFWRGYFDWDTDYAAMCAAVPEEDAFLRAAIGYGSGLRILRQDFWETLITFVISQNNNIPRIQRTVELLCKGWASSAWTAPENLITHSRPKRSLRQRICLRCAPSAWGTVTSIFLPSRTAILMRKQCAGCRWNRRTMRCLLCPVWDRRLPPACSCSVCMTLPHFRWTHGFGRWWCSIMAAAFRLRATRGLPA